MLRTLKYLCVAAALSPGPWLLTDAGAQFTPRDSEAKSAVRKSQKNQGLDPEGRPAAFDKVQGARYAVWRDHQGWHLRTSSDRRAHHYKGQIRVEGGSVEQVSSYRSEKIAPAARWKLKPNKQELAFNFKSNEPLDGIRFRVSPGASRVVFALELDSETEPYLVYIGQKNQFPEVLPMSLPAWPRQVKAGK
jgi:hypothetical protein